MSDNVTLQLQSVIAELEAKETELSQQLEDVQKQKEAIHQVLSMFDNGSTTTVEKPPAKTKKKPTATKKIAKKAETKPASKKGTKQKGTKQKSTAKKTEKKKKDGRAADWQKYTLPGVKDQPMPEAVKLVLSTQPDKDFKIAEVMSSLFKENMPKTQYLKARNRVSNILSGGVRDGEWNKGDRGAYRLNPA